MSARLVRRSAFSLVELIALILVLVVAVLVLLPATARRRPAPILKDSTQLRGIVQGMIIWAGNNQGSYPLPSVIDAQGATVAGPDVEKDTTGNILSIMVFHGMLSPEILVTPTEPSPDVRVMTEYAFQLPFAAVDPVRALWDPAFRGTPIDELRPGALDSKGHQSYAHVFPQGAATGAAMERFVRRHNPGHRQPRAHLFTR